MALHHTRIAPSIVNSIAERSEGARDVVDKEY
jgi:hypothetical protein